MRLSGSLSISVDDLFRPSYEIIRSLTRWLRRDPQFQVLWPVVVSHTVLVVYVLSGQEVTPEYLSHHLTVLSSSSSANDVPIG